MINNRTKIKPKHRAINEKIGDVDPYDLVRYIENREYVTFYYKNQDGSIEGPRFVEPYCLGSKLKDGVLKYYLRAYVVGDTDGDDTVDVTTRHHSVSATMPSDARTGWVKKSEAGWRLFCVADSYGSQLMTDLFGLGRKFSSYRKGYNDNGDRAMDTIIAQLSYSDFPQGENPTTKL
jgi:hypothetical protein